jgi:hypothetical protein
MSRTAKQMFYTNAGIHEVPTFHQPCYIERVLIFLIMKTSDPLRNQLIKSVMALHAEKDAAGAAINLWEQMASQVISIVGEGGFNSLYARSLFLSQPTFPWLSAVSHSQQADSRFAELKTSFAAQAPAHVNEANILLLITLTDIMASIIGEQLTMGILRSAWGGDALDKVSKEFKNE